MVINETCPGFDLEEMVEHLNRIKPGESKSIGSYENALFNFGKIQFYIGNEEPLQYFSSYSGPMSYYRCTGEGKDWTTSTFKIGSGRWATIYDFTDPDSPWKVEPEGRYAVAQVTNKPIGAELRIYP